MKNSFTSNRLKKAADSLKPFVPKSSHRHEIVASYFGFNSRAHLLADTSNFRLDKDDPISFESFSDSPEQGVRNRMEELGLDKSDLAFQISDEIALAITPPCTCCNEDRPTHLLNKDGLEFDHTPLHSMPDDYTEALEVARLEEKAERELLKTEWVCDDCADDPEVAAFCSLCGDGPFHPDLMDHNGLCPEHRGEFDYDEEEQEDRDSFLEYLQNHD